MKTPSKVPYRISDLTSMGNYFITNNKGIEVGEGYTKENADFIVRCCNSHYGLLTACKAASEYLSGKAMLIQDEESLQDTLEEAIRNANDL